MLHAGDSAKAAKAALETVLVVPATDRAAVVVTGGDRVSWLNGIVTCELAKLGPGQGAYGLVVEKKGRLQADFYLVSSDAALALALPATARDAIAETLDHYLVMEDAELSATELSFFHLYGPRAAEIAASSGAPYAGTVDVLGTGGAVVACPANERASLEARLEAAAAEASGAMGDEASLEPLRIERGVPRFGVEIDATQYPQEAALEKLAVSFDKGCYLGQEVVYMLEHRGHVKRKLVPLALEGDALPEVGAPVTTPEGAAVGDVKSAAIGPISRAPAAIAMVKWAQAKPGTELRVDGRLARVRGG